jgi:hypothetical protein
MTVRLRTRLQRWRRYAPAFVPALAPALILSIFFCYDTVHYGDNRLANVHVLFCRGKNPEQITFAGGNYFYLCIVIKKTCDYADIQI